MIANLVASGVTSLLGSVFGAIDKMIPDKDLAAKLKAELQNQLLAFQNKLLDSATSIINTEAKGESWLQRNWRPLTMVTFVSLIVAKWLGFTAPGITEAMEIKLLDIVEIGLGGYVIGRSVEKIAPSIADAIARR